MSVTRGSPKNDARDLSHLKNHFKPFFYPKTQNKKIRDLSKPILSLKKIPKQKST